MRRALFAYAIATLAVAGTAVAANAKWIADEHTQCKVWDNDSGSNDTVIWTGACKNGLATGHGIAQYFAGGILQARYDGEYRGGKRNGHGMLATLSSQGVPARFDGEWHDDVPNGFGTLMDHNSRFYSGNWSNGCLRQGNLREAFTVAKEACGF